MSNATWRKMITEHMSERGESWDDVQHMVLKNKELYYDEGTDHRPPASLDAEFDSGYGGADGCHFTLWTKRRVYFPVQYDGAEWVASVPRDPCNEATSHVGGG